MCSKLSGPTKHQSTYFLTTLQTNISEAREYFLQKKLRALLKIHIKSILNDKVERVSLPHMNARIQQVYKSKQN